MQAEQASGFAEVNGAHLYYELVGAGEPVVLIHGFSLDTRMWDDQWQALTARFRVLRFDARGFGHSSLPDGKPYRHIDDLHALLAQLALECPHVVALSMGGGIAIDYALAYPDGLRSLTLIDSILNGYTGFSEGFRRAAAFREVARSAGLDAARRAWLAHPFFEAANEKPAVAARLRQIVEDYSGWHWLNPESQSLPEPAVDRLPSIRVPTLVMVGERDIEDFRLLAELIAANIPGARLKIIAGAGHMANMEAPDQVNRLLVEFLGEVGGGEE